MVFSGTALIEARNVSKIYYRKNSPIKALDGIDLEVFAGEFLVLTGRSGSGKTTLLNLIGALDRPSSGEVLFEGKNLMNFSNQELAKLRREKIGFIFQTFNLLPSLTVLENIESALIHSPLTIKEITERTTSLLEFFDLADKSDTLPLNLSVGQQQKVAIARAIVKNPVLVLADEPTGEMDPIAGKEIVTKLVELNQKLKTTIVIVSHGAFPHDLAGRTLFLKDGRLVSKIDSGY